MQVGELGFAEWDATSAQLSTLLQTLPFLLPWLSSCLAGAPRGSHVDIHVPHRQLHMYRRLRTVVHSFSGCFHSSPQSLIPATHHVVHSSLPFKVYLTCSNPPSAGSLPSRLNTDTDCWCLSNPVIPQNALLVTPGFAVCLSDLATRAVET
jgi:hypothetical protein